MIETYRIPFDLQVLLLVHCPDLGAEVLYLVQELQGEGGAGEVDAEIALQAHGGPCAAYLRAGEAPMLGFVFFGGDIRRNQAFVHQLDDITGLHCADMAEFGQRQNALLVENDTP